MPAKKKRVAKRVPRFSRALVKRCERGIALLDILLGREEWLRRIDLDKFDITDTKTCVAGSVWDDFGENGFEHFTEALESLTDGTVGANAFGFDESGSVDFQELQDYWVWKIKALKRA